MDAQAQLVDVAKFLPERRVPGVDFIASVAKLQDEQFFKGVYERRFASPEYTSLDLAAHAVTTLLQRNSVTPARIDLVVAACLFGDYANPGIATGLQHRVGAHGAQVMNIDNGCCSWVSALRICEAFIRADLARYCLVVNVTNFVSRSVSFQHRPESSVLGDGAAATLVVRGSKSIMDLRERVYGENWARLAFRSDHEVRNAESDFVNDLVVQIDSELADHIKSSSVRLLPALVRESMARQGITAEDVDLFVTHQPNRYLIDEWGARCGVPAQARFDTLRYYGNLFSASLPVTLAEALETRRLRGRRALLATFSNASEMVSTVTLHLP